MQYKTIVLELLQDHPALYEQLRSSKRLLPTMDAYALDLKACHEEWLHRLSRTRPDSDSRQIASEALELAIQGLQDRLPCESPKDEAEPVSLDAAMNYLRRLTPPV